MEALASVGRGTGTNVEPRTRRKQQLCLDGDKTDRLATGCLRKGTASISTKQCAYCTGFGEAVRRPDNQLSLMTSRFAFGLRSALDLRTVMSMKCLPAQMKGQPPR